MVLKRGIIICTFSNFLPILVGGQLYIPFLDYLWKFDKDCQVRCHYFSIRCFFPSSPLAVCRELRFMHQCCEQFSSTTTTTTSTTTPSTTTSTEVPHMELCTPTRPEMCQPEPGCSLSPHYPSMKKWLRRKLNETYIWSIAKLNDRKE